MYIPQIDIYADICSDSVWERERERSSSYMVDSASRILGFKNESQNWERIVNNLEIECVGCDNRSWNHLLTLRVNFWCRQKDAWPKQSTSRRLPLISLYFMCHSFSLYISICVCISGFPIEITVVFYIRKVASLLSLYMVGTMKPFLYKTAFHY